jgi:hypothetical protein
MKKLSMQFFIVVYNEKFEPFGPIFTLFLFIFYTHQNRKFNNFDAENCSRRRHDTTMKKVKGGFNKVGKSVQTAAASANESIQIETEYLSRKGKSDFSVAFPHEEPVLTKVKIFHSYAKHNEVKSAFERLLNLEKGQSFIAFG